MRKWDELSMREKAEMMRVAVSNGITTLPEIKQAYNEFAEGGAMPEAQPAENIFGRGGKKDNNSKSVFINSLEQSLREDSRFNSNEWRKFFTDLVEKESSYSPNITNSIGAKGYFQLMPFNRAKAWTNPTQQFHEMYKLTGNNLKYLQKNLTEKDWEWANKRGIDMYGMLAGAHLGGVGNVVKAIRGKGNAKDMNGSSVISYMTKFSQNSPTRDIKLHSPYKLPEQEIPFTPWNEWAFYTPLTAYQPVVLPDEQQPIMREAMAYDPKEIERQERQRGLDNFMTLMSMTSPQQDNGMLGAISMLSGLGTTNAYGEGGDIHIKPENRGKFTALKERTGHSATWFKEHGTPAQKKMAIFALNSRHWKHADGGNLFDGTSQPSQQMDRPNIFRYDDGRYVYQAAPNAEEIEVSPINTLLPNPSQWTYQDASGKIYTPHAAQVDTGSIIQDEERNPLVRAANNYFREAAYRAKDGTLALQGKYTMPAIAASALLPVAGEAAYPILTNPYVDAGITSAFAGHGLNHTINEGIDGWGDAAMTAMELAPLGRLARPMWNAGKEAIYNIADRYIFMPHQNSFTRGIGMTDAGLQDAITTGVFRGNPRGTEQTAKVFDKMFLKNRNHFRDIVKDTGIPGIESRYQSRTLTKEDFNALKKASEKYESLEGGNTVGKITLRQSIDPLENYATYEDYIKAVSSDIAKTERMPSRIASGEISPNTELSEPMQFEDESGRMLLPQGKPFLERFGPNSDYLADGTPLSYWYADGRNPVTQGHAYAKSNYGVRVNNPEDYQPFMHELHLHPSFFRSPKFADPNIEIFGKGPLGLTVKLDKETLQPIWKKDLFDIFKKKKTVPQIKEYVNSPKDITSDVGELIAEGSERSVYSSKTNPNIVYKIEDGNAALENINNIKIRSEITDDIIAPETTIGYYKHKNGKYYRVTQQDKYKSFDPDNYDVDLSPELNQKIINTLEKAGWKVETVNGAAKTASKNGKVLRNLEHYNWGVDSKGNLKLIDQDAIENSKPLLITSENATNITPEQWTAAQDAAIARGDMAEAQRLSDLHFKVKAPEANVPDQFHGTHYDDLGNQILLNKGSEQGTNGIGFYTSSNEPYARRYGPNVFGFKVNAKTEDLAQGRFAYLSENRMNELKAQGYKGTIDTISGPMLGAGNDAVEYTFFNPNIYKLQDAVTYDNNGVRIPLGKRHNFNINDIRYGLLPFLGLGTAATLYGKQE